MRIVVMVMATYAFVTSTPVDDLLIVLGRAHAPAWFSIPVSYTHLDVYKRQPQPLANPEPNAAR